MGLRNAIPVTIRPQGLTDSVDGSNSFAGSMSVLKNLVLSYGTPNVFVPRPAATLATDFTATNPTGIVSALLVVGTRAYGMISSSRYPGKDEPFCYDYAASAFVAIYGVDPTLLPATQPASGEWVPPCMVAVTNSLIMVTHPGFAGGSGPYVGWIDISSYSQTVIANTTSGSKILTGVVTTLGSSAPIVQGVQPGQTVGIMDMFISTEAGGLLTTEGGARLIANPGLGSAVAGIPDNTYVVSCANGTFSLSTTGNTHSNTTLDGLASTTGVIAGTLVSGSGIPAGTYVTAVTSGTSVTLSQAATATATGVAINFSGNGTITMSAAATATASNVSIPISGGTINSPLWGAGNLNTNPLTIVPKAVAGFSGRAYIGAGPYLVYTDPLMPRQVSLGSQALVIGDNTDITVLASVPLTSQLTGGVQQSLTVFKGAGALTQITGDAATNNLAQNTVSGSVGTLAPLSIAQTPVGTAFMAVDGLRVLGPSGVLSDPIGTDGTGVVVPFLNALYPSRMCAAYAENVYRITVQNSADPALPFQEYWFDFKTKAWTGPHTCAARMVNSYPNGAAFLLAPLAATGVLWKSDVLPRSSSSYVENGVNLSWTYTTSLLADNQGASFNQVVQTSIAAALRTTDNLSISAVGDAGETLGAVGLSGIGSPAGLWGTGTWGKGQWGAVAAPFREYPVKWRAPLVFRQAKLSISASAASGQALGNIYAKVKPVNVNVPLH